MMRSAIFGCRVRGTSR